MADQDGQMWIGLSPNMVPRVIISYHFNILYSTMAEITMNQGLLGISAKTFSSWRAAS